MMTVTPSTAFELRVGSTAGEVRCSRFDPKFGRVCGRMLFRVMLHDAPVSGQTVEVHCPRCHAISRGTLSVGG